MLFLKDIFGESFEEKGDQITTLMDKHMDTDLVFHKHNFLSSMFFFFAGHDVAHKSDSV